MTVDSNPGSALKAASGSWKFEWIEALERFEAACRELLEEELIAVDTETAGWQTGNERLCLVQIGAPKREKVYLFDVLALGDIKPLDAVLNDKSRVVLAHNASFEERQFGRHSIRMRNVVDTLDLARRLRPDLPSFSLKSCVRFLLDMEMSKEEQVSDWSRRPLTQSQIAYASLDAEITIRLYQVLKAIEDRLSLDPAFDVPELMRELHHTAKERFKLTRNIAADLAYLNLRYDMLRDALRTRLIDGAKPYEGEFGRAKVSRVKQTEINPSKVRSKLPEIAELVIKDAVDKKRFMALVKEQGIDAGMVDLVSDTIGYIDRLSLNLADFD
ncbi:MAG: ribonuclease D [Oligoflexia bacterium]|nr:ribonuclease D [Oligoflexia bacterium]